MIVSRAYIIILALILGLIAQSRAATDSTELYYHKQTPTFQKLAYPIIGDTYHLPIARGEVAKFRTPKNNICPKFSAPKAICSIVRISFMVLPECSIFSFQVPTQIMPDEFGYEVWVNFPPLAQLSPIQIARCASLMPIGQTRESTDATVDCIVICVPQAL